MAAKRDFSDPVALNWTQDGTDVDFGSLTRQLIGYIAQRGMTTLFGHEVTQPAPGVRRQLDGQGASTAAPARSARSPRSSCSSAPAAARCRCCRSRASRRPRASAASPSAASSCAPTTPSSSPAHQAKVYGKAAVGAPPMSVPHLDTRVIDGRSWLLFGPYAGWSPKFLKQGKVTDLPVVGQAEQPRLDARRRRHRARAWSSTWSASCASARPTGSRTCASSRPSAVDSDWELDHRGPARPGDPPQGHGRRARVRHHGARGGRRQHRRSARRVAGCVDRGARHARRAGALLPRPVPGVEAQAQGDGAVARRQAVHRARSCSRRCGTGARRCSSSTPGCRSPIRPCAV